MPSILIRFLDYFDVYKIYLTAAYAPLLFPKKGKCKIPEKRLLILPDRDILLFTIKSARGTAPVTARQPAFVRCQRLTEGQKEMHLNSPSSDGLFCTSLWNHSQEVFS